MNRTYRTLSIVQAAFAAVALAIASPASWANGDDEDEEENPFDEAEIFFELNDTDGDLGIHALIDGDAWKHLSIEDSRGRKMLNIWVRGRLRKQGLTEIFFESAEPIFDELPPSDFFNRFPPGEYVIEGWTLDWEKLESETTLTHLMPAPAGGIACNGGTPINLDSVDCDESGTIPVVTAPVSISWEPVTMSHPDADGGGAGVQPPESVEINNYQVVVEVETEDEDELELSVILPPGTTSLAVPEAFTDLDDDGQIKFEILAREESFNQTAVESCFVLAE